MLRFGKLTDYAMLILSQMAREPASVISAASLADVLHLPTPTVSKILKILTEFRIVGSVRGAEGGYHLAQPADKIFVADVVMAMEGGLAVTECCELKSGCTLDGLCTMKENWKKINGIVYDFLAGVSIVDMLKPLSPVSLGIHHDK